MSPAGAAEPAGLPRRAVLGCLTLGMFVRPALQTEPTGPGSGTRLAVILRHAEKASEPKDDPTLSALGTRRARSLAELFGRSAASLLVASEFQRTQLTLAPLAERLALPIQRRPAAEHGGLVEELRRLPSGALSVVVGHSNTVPQLVHALGAACGGLVDGKLPDDSFDRIFVVAYGASVESSLLELGYAPCPD